VSGSFTLGKEVRHSSHETLVVLHGLTIFYLHNIKYLHDFKMVGDFWNICCFGM